MSLEMARIAVSDGVVLTACTPHIYPGLFENTGSDIIRRVAMLQSRLDAAGIPLKVTHGADIQIVPELVVRLRSGSMPTVAGSRYFLFEPPHHTVPMELSRLIFDALTAGFVPIVTHPERLTWLDDEHYPLFTAAARQGAWLQLTAGAVTGGFGRRARYWSERLLGDGIVHVLATDAHDPIYRSPLLSEGRVAAEAIVGREEAARLVEDRPRAVVEDRDPADVPRPPGLEPGFRGQSPPAKKARSGFLSRLFRG